MAEKKTGSGTKNGASKNSASRSTAPRGTSQSSSSRSSSSRSTSRSSSQSTSSRSNPSRSSAPKNSTSKSNTLKSSTSKSSTSKSSSASARTKKKTSKRPEIFSALVGDDSRSKIIKTCLKLFLVLLLIFALVGLWRHRVEWSCANVMQSAKDAPAMTGSGSGFPISVLGSTILDEDEMSGGIAVLTDTAMTVYNTNSKQAVSRAHYMSTPAMKTAGRYALVVDIGSTKYRVETVAETVADGTADYPLIGGAIAQNGTYILVMQGSARASMISSVCGYDRSGNDVYFWHSSEYYITDAALSPDGKYLALCGIAAADGKLQSCVFIHKVSTNTELVKYPLADTTCLSLGFSNTGTLFAVCSDKVVTFSNYSDNVSTVALNGTLQAYDISYDSGAAIYTAQVSDEEAGTLMLLDSRGTVRCTKDVRLHAIAVSLSDSGCCVLGRGGIEAYKLNGEAIGSWDAEVSAADVLLINGRAYVVEGISISQVRLSHDLEK